MIAPVGWLTDEQRAAVEWESGPLMVLAGAGTGKTTVVVERVRHLLERDPDLQPENVLVLTYNVRAAAELQGRLERRIGLERASRLWVHNFHSFGYRLLTTHRAELGLVDSGGPLDAIGQRLLLRELRPRLAHFLYHDLALNPNPVLGRLADVISRAKDELVTPDTFRAYVSAARADFDDRFGPDAWADAFADLRARRLGNGLRPVRDVRSELRRSPADGERRAEREARREASGTGRAVSWDRLTPEQQDLAAGLQATYLRDAAAFELLRLAEEAEAYATYQATLHERGLVDFGEQQLRAIELLRDHPDLLLRYQGQFRHVLVDEFQDANMAQILLLELVGRGPDKPDDVVVVGDDDQSIYRFRGASYAAFSEFEARFGRPPAWAPARPASEVARLPLLANRRSTARIVAAADDLIAHNPARLKAGLALNPTRGPGDPVEIVHARDEADEADLIVARLRSAFDELPDRLPGPDGVERPKRWADLVVLYRKHRHREAIVERLRRAGIPYSLVGGGGLFLQPEVRDVEAALRVLADPADSVSFTRLLTAGPWRFDAAQILRITRDAAWDGRSVFDAAARIRRERTLTVDIVDDEAADPSREEAADASLRARLDLLFETLDDLIPRAHREGPFAILEDYLVRTHLVHDLIAVETPDAQRSVLSVARFMRFAHDWQAAHERGTLAEFIGHLDLFQEIGGDLEVEQSSDVDLEGVQLMTVYQAKGLEFEVVVVPRLIEGQFPDTRAETQLLPVELLAQRPPDEFAIAEERRLCFVAMTRARRRLILTTINDESSRARPSRFLDEIAGAADGAHPRDRILITGLADIPATMREQAAVDAEGAAALVTASLERFMPPPVEFERRYGLRRRAVEILGALEAAHDDDPDAREDLVEELAAIAREAAGDVDEARRNGLDPLTLRVLARHSPAGASLLALAPLPPAFSHSQFRAYEECPLRYAFERVYRIPSAERRGYLEFGTAIHSAFEGFTRARRDAHAAGLPEPGFEGLQAAFRDAFQAEAFADVQAADRYLDRSEPVLRRFFDRELASAARVVAFEERFVLELDPRDGTAPVRIIGAIDRIDRHPDGAIEIVDYKTGRPKSQREVDEDDQLSVYALALARGTIRDPQTGTLVPPAARLTLYFTEVDQALSTTRSADELRDVEAKLLATARRIRSGDFAANPGQRACSRCDYRRLCPSRWPEG